ncbi:MAG: tetratricopeptide repeat protein [Bacteroidetes bacterium]|nr:tetratricopeptide repeat protein [Bacteroidota bacterium]MBS1539405.1 tetratricopeptide repeat protein [Bacteroidota bacterium]
MKKLIVLFLIGSQVGLAQNRSVDSLEQLLKYEKDNSKKCVLLNELSFSLRTKDTQKSVEYADSALVLAKKTNNSLQIGHAQLNLGVANYYLGKYDQALSGYLAALKLFENLKSKADMAKVLNELGTFKKRQGNLSESKSNFKEALQLSKEVNDSSQIANSLNNLGIAYELSGELTKAMDAYKASAVIKEALGDLNGLSYNYDNMGMLSAKLGHYAEAESLLQLVIDIRKKLNDKIGYSIAVNNLGEVFFQKKEYAKARSYLLDALSHTYVTDYKDLRRYILYTLSEIYSAEENFKEANRYLLMSFQVKDSIYSEQKAKQISELETKYETEKKEDQINLLTQQNEIKDIRIKQHILLIAGMTFFILVLIVLGWLWQNRTKLKQQAALEAARAELRQQQLQAVITSQEEERKRFAADLHDGLGQIISALRLGLSKETIEPAAIPYSLGLLNDMNVEIRNIAFNLMPQVLMKEGLHEALKELAQRISLSGGVQIDVQTYNINPSMSSTERIALYRICQEWVNNTIKYSGCKKISIQAVQHPDELVITLEDDGDGFDPNQLTLGKGNGWKNINSRLSLINGTIEIDSVPGRKGTVAILSVPC